MTNVAAPAQHDPVRVAIFRSEKDLESACHWLLQTGQVLKDRIGVAIRHGGQYLLSVQADAEREDELETKLREANAALICGAHEVPSEYGPAPHPGVREDHDLKLPMGREFPASNWSPTIAGQGVPSPALEPRTRVSNFEEVSSGYSVAQALVEAQRCMNCPDPSCVRGCPAGNHIPDFIAALRARDFPAAARVLRQTSSLPGICGRVCDRARQCEGSCVLRTEGGDPVAIGLLERFVADQEYRFGTSNEPHLRQPGTGRRVAVVGSGPSGLAAAEQLTLNGHSVTVFEALPVPGGALAWGIPTFRLPSAVVTNEIERLRVLGVDFRCGIRVGRDVSLDQLLDHAYEAVFLGAGSTLPIRAGIPGEELNGVYDASEFLSQARLGRSAHSGHWRAPVMGTRLAVIGGGNTAMDAAQTALRLKWSHRIEDSSKQSALDVAASATRLGFEDVTVVYRRSETEMPARRDEIEGAREEGVRFRFLTAPLRFLGRGGRLTAIECVEMQLEQRENSTRPVAVPKSGTEFVLEVDTVVLALGYRIDPALATSEIGVSTSQAGEIVTDPRTCRTSRAGVWAGGDVSHGPDTVVRAMAAGRRAAADIHSYLTQGRESGSKGKWL